MISSTLWAPFLGKDQAVQNATQPAFPPLAPHDKTGTSMRMLIHDIQSGLEQFSARLDGLMTRTEDCRSQVINAKNLLDIEHDRVLTEMADTANRCQSELKLHVGTPAQAHALELVQASQSTTESNIRALEKRIDALQALFQSHTSAMTSIQDQQNALLSAILPLIPSLQNLPSHIDHLKSSLADTVSNAAFKLENSIDTIKGSLDRVVSVPAQQAPSPTLVSVATSTEIVDSPRKRCVSGIPRSTMDDSLAHKHTTVSCRSPKKARLDPSRYSIRPSSPHRALTSLNRPLFSHNRSSHASIDGLPSTPCSQRMTGSRVAAGPLIPAGIPMHGSSHAPSLANNQLTACMALDATALQVLQDRNRSPLTFEPSVGSDSVVSMLLSPHVSTRTPARKPTYTASEASSGVVYTNNAQARRLPGTHDITRSTSRRPRLDLQAKRRSPSRPLQHSTPSTHSVAAPTVSPPKPMSLRERRAQMTLCERTQTKRFISLLPSSDDEE